MFEMMYLLLYTSLLLKMKVDSILIIEKSLLLLLLAVMLKIFEKIQHTTNKRYTMTLK